jgi:hypothetical protein
MRIWRNDAEQRVAWARVGLVLTAAASVALAAAVVAVLVHGLLPAH